MLCGVALSGSACTAYSQKSNCPSPAPSGNQRRQPLARCGPVGSVPFAVVGDYGLSSANCAGQVSRLLSQLERVHGQMTFVATTGDNDYWDGSCGTMGENIGALYGKYFSQGTCVDPTLGSVGGGVGGGDLFKDREVGANNIFFPTLGNHDWDRWSSFSGRIPYLQYFPYLKALPPGLAPGEFYTVSAIPGLVDLFSLNSNLGNSKLARDKEMASKQTLWLEEALAASSAPIKLVYFHHPPFSTAQHDPLAPWMALPFKNWGATAVLSGHQHVYERLNITGIPYIVNGLGGHPWLYDIHNCDPAEGSQVRYNAFHGLMIGVVDPETKNATMCFYSIENGGTKVDEFSL